MQSLLLDQRNSKINRLTVKFLMVSLMGFCLILAGCASKEKIGRKSQRDQRSFAAVENKVQNLLDNAALYSDADQAFEYILQSCEALLAEGFTEEAGEIILQVYPETLSQTNQLNYYLTLAKVHLVASEANLALDIFDQFVDPLMMRYETSTQQLVKASLLRAEAYEQIKNYEAAITERVMLDAYLYGDVEQRALNKQMIWQDLTAMDLQSLIGFEQAAKGRTLKAWVQLGSIYQSDQDDLKGQVARIRQWQANNNNHPASTALPYELEQLIAFVDRAPQKVALLLPLQGKVASFAKSIVEGYMQAYYNTMAKQKDTASVPASQMTQELEVVLYDTSSTDDIEDLYDQAVYEGAEVVVGPLQKNNITSLIDDKYGFDVPTIVLNTTGLDEYPEQLYSFSLTPEQEGRQIATQMLHLGHSKAAIVYAEDSWSKRAFKAFKQTFDQEGIELANVASFNKKSELSDLIKTFLLVSGSQERSQTLKFVLGQSIKSEPRRRQDIDFVYLIASPAKARQVKPLLDYYYADDLPVYASSTAFNGLSDTKRNKDLDGVYFVGMPWYLSHSEIKRSNISFMEKLKAFGADAYLLQSRVLWLDAINNAKLYGHTGILNMPLDEKKEISSQLLWAKFKKGKAQVVEFKQSSHQLNQAESLRVQEAQVEDR